MIQPKYNESINRICNEISAIIGDLPAGKKNMVINRLSKIKVINTKISKTMETTHIPEQSSEQIAARYNAQKAILEAMLGGRHISFLDSQEFKICEMHTAICYIRKHIESKGLPYELKGEWFEFAPGKRAKMYHIEKVEE